MQANKTKDGWLKKRRDFIFKLSSPFFIGGLLPSCENRTETDSNEIYHPNPIKFNETNVYSVNEIPIGELLKSILKLSLGNEFTIGQLIHYERVSRALESKFGIPNRISNMVNLLLDSRKLENHFKLSSPLKKSQFGFRFVFSDNILTSDKGQKSPHAYQVLAFFGDIGLPLKTPMFAEGCNGSIEDLLFDCQKNFQLKPIRDVEPEWAISAFISYIKPTSRWLNRWGDKINLNECLSFLLETNDATSSCAGIHKLNILIKAIKLDFLNNFLTKQNSNKIREYIFKRTDFISKSQNSKGAWGLRIKNEPPDNLPTKDDYINELLVTSHILESILFFPKEFMPPKPIIKNGYFFLADQIRKANPSDISNNYCPFSHAAIALIAWQEMGDKNA